jgi:hypothetical protein
LTSLFGKPECYDNGVVCLTIIHFRIATDLNLHVKSTTKILNEHHERELLNRTRTWLNLYTLDCSTSVQLGRPASIRPDPIIRSCKEVGRREAWWRSSPFNNPFDLHLCAYVDLMSSIISEFQERIYWNSEIIGTSLGTNMDPVKIGFQYDDKVQEWNAKTAVSFAVHSDSSSPQCAYRVQLLPFYVSYFRLVMLSLVFKRVIQHDATSVDPELVKRCLNAACGVVNTVVDLAPKDYFLFAPNDHFTFSSFASAFLVKMLRPEHATLLDTGQRAYIIDLVERLVDTLKASDLFATADENRKLIQVTGVKDHAPNSPATLLSLESHSSRLHPVSPPPARWASNSNVLNSAGPTPIIQGPDEAKETCPIWCVPFYTHFSVHNSSIFAVTSQFVPKIWKDTGRLGTRIISNPSLG